MTMRRLVEEVAAATVAATANVTQKRASGQGGIGGDDDDDEDVASPPSFSVVDAAMVNFKKTCRHRRSFRTNPSLTCVVGGFNSSYSMHARA